ncbi:uncharacterized protein ATNIH1004_005936 [Aspergillus tanneri]|uniref:Uncharacterized protein n=1 Tax=Aspergillus tanneri TaxID=1220188 RepID=A0A5M9MMV6_9EURO|nr:uncharacterized protein ATNIH1004_005936 [Aspergillus tanneri]KAA8647246.1 hypothetical protein ATNIH1004_005936 [Aspergillus tanneri]
MIASKSYKTAMANDEMDGLGELASSKPISLSQLCTRASSRSKNGRAVKALLAQMDTDNKLEEPQVGANGYGAGQDRPLTRVPALHHANNGESRWDCYPEEDPAPSRLHSQGHIYGAGEQGWYRSVNSHQQQNPLSYSSDFGSAFHAPRSQQHSCISESPFLKNNNYPQSEHNTWPAAMHHMNERPSLSALQSDSYRQSLIPESNFVSDSSLNLYRASFDRPDNQSPYGSLRLQPSCPRNPGSYETSSAVNPQHERYRDYAFIRSGTTLTDFPQEQNHEASKYPREYRPQTSASCAQPSYHAQASYTSSTRLSTPDTFNPYKNGARDETIACHGVVQNPTFHIRQTALPDPFVETKPPTAHRHQELDYKSKEIALLSAKLDEYIKYPHKQSPADHLSDSGKETLKSLCESAAIEQPPFKRKSPIDYMNSKLKESLDRLPTGLRSTAAGKIIRPPPGIPKPVMNQMVNEPSYLVIGTNIRLNNANSWFHRDPRGEEHLRQQVTDIAQNYAESVERLTGADGTTAKQMTLLLGNVIVNLHSYVGTGGQTSNFSDFVGEKACHWERFCGRRSYFDRDPSIGNWRVPLGRTLSSMSTKTDQNPS